MVLPNLPVVFHVQLSKAHIVDLPEGILQQFLNDVAIVLVMDAEGDLVGEGLEEVLNVVGF